MCGRYASARKRQELLEEFQVERDRVTESLPPDYNVAPTKPVYAVVTRLEKPEKPESGAREPSAAEPSAAEPSAAETRGAETRGAEDRGSGARRGAAGRGRGPRTPGCPGGARAVLGQRRKDRQPPDQRAGRDSEHEARVPPGLRPAPVPAPGGRLLRGAGGRGPQGRSQRPLRPSRCPQTAIFHPPGGRRRTCVRGHLRTLARRRRGRR